MGRPRKPPTYVQRIPVSLKGRVLELIRSESVTETHHAEGGCCFTREGFTITELAEFAVLGSRYWEVAGCDGWSLDYFSLNWTQQAVHEYVAKYDSEHADEVAAVFAKWQPAAVRVTRRVN
jgi:hypothetical protein